LSRLEWRFFGRVDRHVLRFAEFRASWCRANGAELIMFPPRAASEHDPEKWKPVFRKDHAQTKRDNDAIPT
jgi:hypothetical protein